jgi:hypothetical protein
MNLPNVCIYVKNDIIYVKNYKNDKCKNDKKNFLGWLTLILAT